MSKKKQNHFLKLSQTQMLEMFEDREEMMSRDEQDMGSSSSFLTSIALSADDNTKMDTTA